MKVKIIVYSFSGNTLAVSKKLQDALKQENIATTLEEVKTTTEKEMDWTKVNLSFVPLTNDADCIIFAAPVQAFRLVPIMSAYFHTIDDLKNKPCFFFTTEFFPLDWMGGIQARKMATDYIAKKNGRLLDKAIIHWKKKNLEEKINQVVTSFVQQIKDLS